MSKHMKNKSKRISNTKLKFKHSIINPFTLLLIMILWTIIFNQNASSKYTTEVQGNGRSRVARFKVEMITQETNDFIIDGIENNTIITYTFNITNESEVTTNFNVVLTMNEALQKGIDIIIALDGIQYSPDISSDGKIITFSNLGNIGINTTKEVTLTFISGEQGTIKKNQNIDFKLETVVYQVD